MDDSQRIVKCGNLSLHSAGGFFKKRWLSKYLVLYDGSKSGIKRLELFDSEIKFKKQNPSKIIALVDCVRVVTCQRSHKTRYTFEVRMSGQLYLLAAQTFQDMNDWVNCIRLVAFGQPAAAAAAAGAPATPASGANHKHAALGVALASGLKPTPGGAAKPSAKPVDVLLDSHSRGQPLPALEPAKPTSASQAAAAAACALARTRQRQPSLLGSCKPQPPTDSPFISALPTGGAAMLAAGHSDTLTPTVRGQLMASAGAGARESAASRLVGSLGCSQSRAPPPPPEPALDEEEENMLYCSIEDNPSEHNYRVKVIESELAQRCRLECYPPTESATVDQQYEQLGRLGRRAHPLWPPQLAGHLLPPAVTFYQLIIGPQQLTLLNDYAAFRHSHQQQGLWSWPYQCIRRYGFDKDNCFMFEAGRKCTSGPGQFIVQTPKAYNIYQDVVKFVNELRSLGATEQRQSAAAGAPPKLASLQPAPTITHIPVTWTPPAPSSAVDAMSASGQADKAQLATLASKQQFFRSLQNLDSSAHALQRPPAASELARVAASQQATVVEPSKPQVHQKPTGAEPKRDHASQLSLGGSPSAPAATDSATSSNVGSISPSSTNSTVKKCDSDETDESGYEQGCEDSMLASQKSTCDSNEKNNNNNNKSQSTQHQSPQSSGPMSTGVGAVLPTVPTTAPARPPFPIYSVINKKTPANQRKSIGSRQESHNVASSSPDVRPTKTNDVSTGGSTSAQIAPRSAAAVDVTRPFAIEDHEDFEATLIRDVYSEISKLHATFAVTTEDSMSSHSSNSVASNETYNQEHELSSASSTDESSNSLNGRNRPEPTYTNLRSRRSLPSSPKIAPNPKDDNHISAKQQWQSNALQNERQPDGQDRHKPTHNNRSARPPIMPKPILDHTNISSYEQQDIFNYFPPKLHPMYMTTLNPIPECREPAGHLQRRNAT